jgi:DNA processing protein
MTGREALAYLALKYRGDWDKMVDGVKAHEDFDSKEAEEAVHALPCPYLTLIDKAYPEAFKHCYRPPLVLFYYGDISLIYDEKKCVSYVGSREASGYGIQMAQELASGLAKEGFVIVSGLAMGIDAAATKAALDAGGKAVGFLGSGIDLCYPSTSQELYERLKTEGLVLSEYPYQTPPDREHFPQRNRMVAAVSKGVIVGEASKKSGTLITVGYALGFTKEIGCVPYPAGSESACNILIKEGAQMIENLDDANLLMGYIPSETTKG